MDKIIPAVVVAATVSLSRATNRLLYTILDDSNLVDNLSNQDLKEFNDFMMVSSCTLNSALDIINGAIKATT